MEKINEVARANTAVIFTKSTCDLCDSITKLFHELGANPAIHELDKDHEHGEKMGRALRGLGCKPTVPAVFVGGEFFSNSTTVLKGHLDGSLKTKLVEANVIWL